MVMFRLVDGGPTPELYYGHRAIFPRKRICELAVESLATVRHVIIYGARGFALKSPDER